MPRASLARALPARPPATDAGPPIARPPRASMTESATGERLPPRRQQPGPPVIDRAIAWTTVGSMTDADTTSVAVRRLARAADRACNRRDREPPDPGLHPQHGPPLVSRPSRKLEHVQRGGHVKPARRGRARGVVERQTGPPADPRADRERVQRSGSSAARPPSHRSAACRPGSMMSPSTAFATASARVRWTLPSFTTQADRLGRGRRGSTRFASRASHTPGQTSAPPPGRRRPRRNRPSAPAGRSRGRPARRTNRPSSGSMPSSPGCSRALRSGRHRFSAIGRRCCNGQTCEIGITCPSPARARVSPTNDPLVAIRRRVSGTQRVGVGGAVVGHEEPHAVRRRRDDFGQVDEQAVAVAVDDQELRGRHERRPDRQDVHDEQGAGRRRAIAGNRRGAERRSSVAVAGAVASSAGQGVGAEYRVPVPRGLVDAGHGRQCLECHVHCRERLRDEEGTRPAEPLRRHQAEPVPGARVQRSEPLGRIEGSERRRLGGNTCPPDARGEAGGNEAGRRVRATVITATPNVTVPAPGRGPRGDTRNARRRRAGPRSDRRETASTRRPGNRPRATRAGPV